MSCIEKPRFSCALGGALAAINALPQTAAIVHASQGCGGNLFMAAYGGSGYLGSGYCGGQSMPSSNVWEADIVFGGEKRLQEQIEATLELINADLYIVASSCMTEIIADDVPGVVRKFNNSDYDLFAVETGGFKGNSYRGYEILMETLFAEYVDKSAVKNPNLVNILGIIPAYDPFFRGDLEEIARILALLGIRTNTFFSNRQEFSAIKEAGSAALNIVFSRTYGVEAAEKIKESHGIPYYICDLPIGAEAAKRFIRETASLLNLDEARTNRVIARENTLYYAYIDKALDIYTDGDFQFYALIIANANGALPMARYVSEELGWLVRQIYITDDLSDAQMEALTRAWRAMGQNSETELIFETDASQIARKALVSLPRYVADRYFNPVSPLFVLGSSLEKELSSNIGAKSLNVSFPISNRLIVNRAYAGFSGGLNLLEDIVSTLVAAR